MDNKPTGKPAKDLLERFIYSEERFLLLTPIPHRRQDNPKKTRPMLEFSGHMIAVLNFMFYEMYRTRWKKEKGNQEVCFLALKTISNWSSASLDHVKDTIYYAVKFELLNQLTNNTRSKNMFAPGELLYKLYPQKLSTGENLSVQRTQFEYESGCTAHSDYPK